MLGQTIITAPAGWRQTEGSTDRLVLSSADGHERATISLVRFDRNPTIDEFKNLCEIRIELEKKELKDGFVQAQAPVEIGETRSMFFSGGDRKNGRVFTGQVSLASGELVTVYVEGMAVAPKDHLDSFKAIVNGMSRKSP